MSGLPDDRFSQPALEALYDRVGLLAEAAEGPTSLPVEAGPTDLEDGEAGSFDAPSYFAGFRVQETFDPDGSQGGTFQEQVFHVGDGAYLFRVSSPSGASHLIGQAYENPVGADGQLKTLTSIEGLTAIQIHVSDGVVRVYTGAALVAEFKFGGGVELFGADKGLVAHSPDGTAYVLAPPNGGGAATWAAV